VAGINGNSQGSGSFLIPPKLIVLGI